MNIDEKIKQELEGDSLNIDDVIIDDEGLFSRMTGIFKGGMKNWVILIFAVAVIVGVLFLWTGYRFFTSHEIQDQVFWGICFMIALNMQGFIKQWMFMETNRNSIMREVKRVEVAVARLSAKMKD